jgi:hypothetical protein
MILWPTNISPPLNAVNISYGDNSKRRKCESGRTEVRRFGSGSPDICSATFRMLKSDIPNFIEFYEVTSNMGLNWFSADWLSDLGYTSHAARIIGYPKRSAYGTIYNDFSVNLQIKELSTCWPDTLWPTLAP